MPHFVDHIVIRVDDLDRDTDLFSEMFGFEPYAYKLDHGFIAHSVYRIGTVDIELLKAGKKSDFSPYLYGVSFGSDEDAWSIIDDLSDMEIRHSLPSSSAISLSTGREEWQNIIMADLLDNPPPIPMAMHRDTISKRLFARVSDFAFGSAAVKKALLTDYGDAMAFFTIYKNQTSALRQEAEKRLIEAGGGIFGLSKLHTVNIEAAESYTKWLSFSGALFNPEELTIERGANNHLLSTTWHSSTVEQIKRISFGTAEFVIAPTPS
ncbi:hypothetical protein T7987_03265 [Sulfitobacter faviae]|uniref:Glyoxalase-like domain-containing protein n=1 Tax=Sulfitobacter faviae TaxID=1775881 RepID=A0ABZ0V2W9_9RHOB|nr:hypothetical protein [Sulfitobacter faviae]WPZ22271.1 hypothetical protein T7987_03265 [Sulfitobacter faviae]